MAPLAPQPLAISVDPIGHWHVLVSKTLRFRVVQGATKQGMPGLRPTVQVAGGGGHGDEGGMMAAQAQDEGAGVYSLEHTPLTIGPYALVLRFGWQGQEVVSSPTAFEVVRDGEEGIRVDARGTSYVYQVRYNWEPGEAHASDTERVRLVFELMRGIPEGVAIRWDQPWLNAFNHVTNAEDARVTVASTDGAVSEALRPVYRGMGVYEAERVFSVAEVGAGREYDVRFTFTDPYNGARVTHSEPYRLRAVPSASRHP